MAKKGKKQEVEEAPGSDSDYEDTGKKPSKKQLEKQAKKQADADKKKEREALLAMEEETLTKSKGGKGKKGKKGGNSDLDDALNSFGPKGTIDAHGVEDSLAALSLLKNDVVPAKDIDRHPERRFKAALAAYTERRLPEVKKENPGLRKQQLEQLIYKEFQKSDENPMNKETNISYNAKTDDVLKVKETIREKRTKKYEK
ncbi:hypothetical protein KL918_003006 [Ogataea parapolymorpha]|uniref:Coiled-coil domain-containing protein n=1 Tax=Ogataea parapolymorpha (strain ATCC 26012 / BCRC 20466 / JCM 22074 / NRRL Y-7560 / DL-1) TaxID=871575 RepID=W1QBC4_OGAPD|nr:hypothetical protein HPODL_01725 [Ogataea parapolymorpha DL-1]ESW97633.1 hypothetical protein HPODL_01725 [Ogataea parapolymorpha DL-1]KAG7866811.1 hypothetical protein KL918_003006 [Ogataea parapolymorpha]KAG7871962.1 hypothetical protein KL916_003565 [Ogataea parapolymorpha]KAG7882535.1 hypothetical protein KL938_002958 [Ogataea parapolymorpha]